jgi:hypothetical protein
MIVYSRPRATRAGFFYSLQKGHIEIEEGFVHTIKGQKMIVVAIEKIDDDKAKLLLTLVAPLCCV